MILSHRDYQNGQRYDADVVVIGTGAGGAVGHSSRAQGT